ncbi:MAG: amidohydrolase family protein [Candidatus Thermoplasmatota archaeon]|nr:amidohydrolase family protein [Candidatus Thermoplasmatota archaeon]
MDDVICGNFFIRGEFQEGWIERSTGIFHSGLEGKPVYTCFPEPVNAHTHLGDSFMSQEPRGTLAEVVGPRGLKARSLLERSDREIIDSIISSIRFMKEAGTSYFMDYRETGLPSKNQFQEIKNAHVGAIILARPGNISDLSTLSEYVDGIGISSISDIGIEKAAELSVNTKKLGLIVSTHFSEERVEDFSSLAEFSPDLVIHGSALKEKEQFQDLSDITRNIAICPRSNRYFGIDQNYSIYGENGMNVMMGTDNAMISNPDIFQEMEFLFRIQKNVSRIEPEEILQMCTWNSLDFIFSRKKATSMNWICIERPELSAFSIITRYWAMKNYSLKISETIK